MIRGIIFDCFGVLYGGGLETLTNMCPPENIGKLRDLDKATCYGYITTEQYIAGVAELFGQTPGDIAGLLRQKHVRNTDLVEFAGSLRGSYKTGLLSNVGDGIVESLLTPDELKTNFDTVILSYREHIAKPNPEIFTFSPPLSTS